MEVDISKFDKSETNLHIDVVIALYRAFGLDNAVEYLWRQSQTQTIVKDKLNGIIVHLLFQQKSGNCDTYGSNTWATALALLDTMPLEKAALCVFGVDDSLILFEKDKHVLLIDPCRKLSAVWNFDCKMLSPKIPLFYGKFLSVIGNHFRFLLDPMKAIQKLGQSGVKDGKHLSKIFVSIQDSYKSYQDYRCLSSLNEATMDRYSKYNVVCDDAAFCSLNKYFSDSNLF